jgi:hypothetical protein
MRTIEVDDEVFAYLENKAIPYVETTPNLTLRRLFNLNGKTSSGGIRRKQPKANLQTLIKADLIREGQTLFLHDYQGRRIDGYEAIVSGKSLLCKGEPFSMSDLAKICLNKEGFRSNSVRGPAHWYNSDGISVKKLWNHFLNKGMANEETA